MKKRAAKTDSPPAIPTNLDTDSFKTAWARWTQYRKESRKPLTPTTTEAQLRKLSQAGPETAVLMIEQSIEHGWQGLFDLKNQAKGGQFTPAPAVTTDYSGAERQF